MIVSDCRGLLQAAGVTTVRGRAEGERGPEGERRRLLRPSGSPNPFLAALPPGSACPGAVLSSCTRPGKPPCYPEEAGGGEWVGAGTGSPLCGALAPGAPHSLLIGELALETAATSYLGLVFRRTPGQHGGGVLGKWREKGRRCGVEWGWFSFS